MAAPVTSSDATRNITLACIGERTPDLSSTPRCTCPPLPPTPPFSLPPCAVAGTVLLVVFVAWKMRRRVRCSCSCWSLADPAAAERRRVLASAAVLYQAAAANPDFK